MELRIVGIHGVGNHQRESHDGDPAAHIARRWTDALRTGIPAGIEVDLRIAYYADRLRRDLEQAPGAGLDWLTPDEYESLRAWAVELGAGPTDVAQAAWSVPARMLADRIAEHRGLNVALVRPFVATFVKEVNAYLRPHNPARSTVRHQVASLIRAYRPHILIAHSLGSVIAYETLWAHPDLAVDLLITLGSPLAMRWVVFDRLQPTPADGSGQRPRNATHWINIADPGDIVAVPRPFTRRFQPDTNDERCHIHWGDFHSATRYLAARPTAAAITAYLLQHGPIS